MTDDFFDDAVDIGRGGVRRDGQGRAMLKPPGLDIEVPYTPASSLSSYVSNSYHIHKWRMRYLAKGLGRRPDLGRLAASEPYSTGLYANLDGLTKKDSGRRLDEIINRALDYVTIDEKADYGTAFHQFTEPGAPPLPEGDEELAKDVASFEETLKRECVVILDTEAFTANEVTNSAGTFDHGVRVLGHPYLTGYVVADKKTGKFEPFEWAIQISSYARGERYDRTTHERSPLAPDVNLDWGLVIYTQALTGKTILVPIDIGFGWEMAQLAAAIRDGHERKDVAAVYKSPSFSDRARACQTKDDLRTLWESTTDPVQRAAITERAKELP